MAHHMKVHRARSGFTLVELVIVLAVLSLVAGLAAPRFSSAAVRYRVKAAARRVAADVALARNTARAKSKSMTIAFSVGASGYYDVWETSNSGTMTFDRTQLGQDPYRVVLKSADFGGAPKLVFNGFGEGVSGDVSLSCNGWVCAVHIDGMTGIATYTGP